MPVICTKEKNKYEIITGRILEKRRADSKVNNQASRNTFNDLKNIHFGFYTFRVSGHFL